MNDKKQEPDADPFFSGVKSSTKSIVALCFAGASLRFVGPEISKLAQPLQCYPINENVPPAVAAVTGLSVLSYFIYSACIKKPYEGKENLTQYRMGYGIGMIFMSQVIMHGSEIGKSVTKDWEIPNSIETAPICLNTSSEQFKPVKIVQTNNEIKVHIPRSPSPIL